MSIQPVSKCQPSSTDPILADGLGIASEMSGKLAKSIHVDSQSRQTLRNTSKLTQALSLATSMKSNMQDAKTESPIIEAGVKTALSVGTQEALSYLRNNIVASKAALKLGSRWVPAAGEVLLVSDLSAWATEDPHCLEIMAKVRDKLNIRASDGLAMVLGKLYVKRELKRTLSGAKALALPSKWLDKVIDSGTDQIMQVVAPSKKPRVSETLRAAFVNTQQLEKQIGELLDASLALPKLSSLEDLFTTLNVQQNDEKLKELTSKIDELLDEKSASILHEQPSEEKLNELTSKIDELLEGQAGSIEEAIAELSKQISQQHKPTPEQKDLIIERAAEMRQRMDVVASTLGLIGQLTNCPELVKGAGALKGMSSVFEGVASIAAQGLSFGAVGAVVAGVSHVLNVFSGPDAQTRMFKATTKQLKVISKQIACLHDDMRLHFNQVFYALGIIHQNVLQGFSCLADGQAEIYEELGRLQAKQDIFQQKQQLALAYIHEKSQHQASIQRQMLQELDESSVSRNLDIIAFQKDSEQLKQLDNFRNAMFETWHAACVSSSRDNLTGGHYSMLSWEDVSELQNVSCVEALPQNIKAVFKLEQLSIGSDRVSQQVVNPFIWIESAQLLQGAIEAYAPSLSKLPEKELAGYITHIEEVIQVGQNTLESIQHFPIANVFRNTVATYKKQLNEWVRLVEAKIQKWTAEQERLIGKRLGVMLQPGNAGGNIPFGYHPCYNLGPIAASMKPRAGTVVHPDHTFQQAHYLCTGGSSKAKAQVYSDRLSQWPQLIQKAANACKASFKLSLADGPKVSQIIRYASSDSHPQGLKFPCTLNASTHPELSGLLKAEALGLLKIKPTYSLTRASAGGWSFSLDLSLIEQQGAFPESLNLARFNVAGGFAYSGYSDQEVVLYLVSGGFWGGSSDLYDRVPAKSNRPTTEFLYERHQTPGIELTHLKVLPDHSTQINCTLHFKTNKDSLTKLKTVESLAAEYWTRQKDSLIAEIEKETSNLGGSLFRQSQKILGLETGQRLLGLMGGNAASALQKACAGASPLGSTEARFQALSDRVYSGKSFQNAEAKTHENLALLQEDYDLLAQSGLRSQKFVQRIAECNEQLGKCHQMLIARDFPEAIVEVSLKEGLALYAKAKYYRISGDAPNAYATYYLAVKALKNCSEPLAQKKLEKAKKWIKNGGKI